MSGGKLSLLTQVESARTILVRQQLLRSLKDRDYRTAFVRERVRSSVALQIRALREQRNKMTQKQLGDAIGMAQTWVSKLENPEYGKMTVATLLRLVEAFDTDLEIKFRPFSQTLGALPTQGPEYFNVPSFDEELADLERNTEAAIAAPHGINLAEIGRQIHEALLTFGNATLFAAGYGRPLFLGHRHPNIPAAATASASGAMTIPVPQSVSAGVASEPAKGIHFVPKQPENGIGTLGAERVGWKPWMQLLLDRQLPSYRSNAYAVPTGVCVGIDDMNTPSEEQGFP